MRASLKKLLAAVHAGVDLQDLFVFGGLACACTGAAQIYPPAGWIVAGVALFWLGVRP